MPHEPENTPPRNRHQQDALQLGPRKKPSAERPMLFIITFLDQTKNVIIGALWIPWYIMDATLAEQYMDYAM
jgi:hypothetical protein